MDVEALFCRQIGKVVASGDPNLPPNEKTIR